MAQPPSLLPAPGQPPNNASSPSNPQAFPQIDLDKFIPYGIDPKSVVPGAVQTIPQPQPLPDGTYQDVGLATEPAYLGPETSLGQGGLIGQPPTLRIPSPNGAPVANRINEQATWKFSFYQAPWELVLRNFANENGFSLNVAVLPNGDFTFFDQKTYSVTEAIDVLNDHLMARGFLLIRNHSQLSLIASNQGVPEGMVPFVLVRDIQMLGRNEVAAVAFPLRQNNSQILQEVQQLLSHVGSAKILSSSNRLVVIDTGAYLRRMRDLLGGYGFAAGDQETIVIHLNSMKAESLAEILNQRFGTSDGVQTASTGAMASRGPLIPIAESNSLLVTGTADQLASMQQLIAEIDRTPPQVVIQGLLVEVNLGNAREIGAELGLQDSVLFDRSVIDNIVTLNQTNTAPNGVQTTNQNIISQTAAPGFAFNNSALGNNVAVRPNTIGSQSLSTLGLGRASQELGFGGLVLSASSNSVNALLRAVAAKYQTDILSRPQIRTLDNKEALIQIGQQVPVIDGVNVTPVGSANPIIRQDRAGIILRVTPHVAPDGLIQIRVEAEKSAFRLAPGSGVPVFTDATNGNVIQAPIKDLTTAQTTVSARAGQTIVLGGMITSDEATVNRKVPFLGDIPLIGRLFRFDKHSKTRKELLIFLTPHIIGCGSDEETFKATEMQRIQINLGDAMQMHGPILEQLDSGFSNGGHGLPASQFMMPEAVELPATRRE